MAALLSSDKDMGASFLNSVLNQLNWAFSEFIGMIQEVGGAVSPAPHQHPELHFSSHALLLRLLLLLSTDPAGG